MAYLALALAIAADIGATLALQRSNGLSQWAPAALSIIGYLIVFVAVSIALTAIPVSLVYAIWSGVGTAAVTLTVDAERRDHVPCRPTCVHSSLVPAIWRPCAVSRSASRIRPPGCRRPPPSAIRNAFRDEPWELSGVRRKPAVGCEVAVQRTVGRLLMARSRSAAVG